MVIGDLGDDHVLGGAGQRRRGGGQPRDRHGQRRRAATTTSSTATTATTAWTAAPASGDIASFATDVGAGKSGGVKVSLAKHKARGDGHDRLFRFEALEGSAFDDILVGNKQAQRDRRRPRQRHAASAAAAPTRSNGGQGKDGCKGAKGRTTSCGKEREAESLRPTSRSTATPGGGGGLAIVGGGGPDHFVVAYDPRPRSSGSPPRKGIAIGPGCSPRPADSPTQVTCALGGPARWLMADLGPGNDSLIGRRLARPRSASSASPAGSATTRSKAGPRTT